MTQYAMAGAQRNITEWRQGNVLQADRAEKLNLVSPTGRESTVVVVVSHDCDIACDAEREPSVEVIVGHRIDKIGADSHSKTARRLHLAYSSGESEIAVELPAASKVSVPKAELLAGEPREDMKLGPDGVLTLQHWLASRYHRAAFADEFNDRIKAKPARLDRKIAAAAELAGKYLLAVFFDVDDGAEVARDGPDDVYRLRVTLLYDSATDEPAAYEAAKKASDEIEAAFEAALIHDGRWRGIELLSCEPMSDSAMTVSESRKLKRWQLDHMSLEDDPPQPLFTAP